MQDDIARILGYLVLIMEVQNPITSTYLSSSLFFSEEPTLQMALAHGKNIILVWIHVEQTEVDPRKPERRLTLSFKEEMLGGETEKWREVGKKRMGFRNSQGVGASGDVGKDTEVQRKAQDSGLGNFWMGVLFPGVSMIRQEKLEN